MATTASGCPFDHLDSSVSGDERYATYRELRPEGPVWSSEHGGFWLLTGFDDVRAALRDHGTFSSAGGCFLPDRAYRSLALEQDPPDHGPFRDLFLAAVGRPAVVRHETVLDEMVTRVVAEFGTAGGGDVRAGISEKIPVEGIALLLGLSPLTAGRVRELTTEAWKRMYSDPTALGPMTEMLLGEADARRDAPRDDFLTTLVTTTVDGRPLSDDEIGNVLAGAVVAGHETTMNASMNLIYELARDAELQASLRQSPERIGHVVEEALRHRAPIHLFFRTVTRDVVFSEVAMRRGDKVAVVYAGANRDPERFPEPDRFDPGREDVTHLSFGWGVHRCVGSYLAQAELRLLTRALLDQGPLAVEDAEAGPLVGGHHVGFSRLVVSVGAGT